MSDQIKVYKSEDGSAIYQTPDGNMHDSLEEAEAFMAEHQVEMLVGQFMAEVGNLPETHTNKKGVVPGERALQAMQTRLSKAATLFAGWYLGRA